MSTDSTQSLNSETIKSSKKKAISTAGPENLEIKKEFYNKLRKVAPKKTIFTTNTSTIIPSQLADDTGRPRRFLAMHFANKIWERNLVEIMGHSNSDPVVFVRVVEFARKIGMVPIPIEKEQPGYLLDTLLIPLLSAAGTLLLDDIAKAEDIDRAWMIGTGAPLGPFAFLDMIGMRTVYNVTKKVTAENPEDKKFKQKERFYKEKLGVSTGEGFYIYPDPKFKDPNFLRV